VPARSAAEARPQRESAREALPAVAPESIAPPPGQPVLMVTEREILQALPELGFGHVVFGGEAANLAALATHPGFRTIVASVETELDRLARSDPRAGVGIRHSHRLFDRGWLHSTATHLSLVGVVNRLDREPFAPEHCGETRLVYRLAYATSRLPLTFNVVFWQDGETCAEVSRRWLVDRSAGAVEQAAALRAGPLSAERLSAERFKSVELNVQTVRWPAVVHPSLGGHAEYFLQVFHRQGEDFVAAPLENTPDVARLADDERLRNALLAWLRAPEQQASIDAGTLRLPEAYLATSARSVTPRGLARLANRPFSQIFSPPDFAGLDVDAGVHVRSAAAVLRRLDGLTCGGCHQSRSIAGFHLLGEDPPEQTLDALMVGASPHLLGDLDRRRAYHDARAVGRTGALARPLSEHGVGQGGAGSRCGLGDPGFAAWTCREGLDCMPLDDRELGVCVDARRVAGSPCEVGSLRSFAEGHRDRARAANSIPCVGDSVCNSNRVGFPQGMCTTSCADLQEGEACGVIVELTPFNHCIARGEPFADCVRAHGHPAGVGGCDVSQPCRDDYICARSPNDRRGMCIPPYFLFQMRVDGHLVGPA